MQSLNLGDIQGGILCGYNFPAGLHYFVQFKVGEHGDATEARALLRDLLPEVTHARPWPARPDVTLNLALTFSGLKALGVDEALLETLPLAFQQPIKQRAYEQLGDTPEEWDEDFGDPDTHLLILLGSSEIGKANSFEERFPRLAKRARSLQDLLEAHGARWRQPQQVEALTGQREHFGFADGAGQPAVEGVTNNLPGQGVPEPGGGWRDIKPGEFILGYPDEDRDTFRGRATWLLYDGTFMVYRKLQENVPLFCRMVLEQGRRYAEARLNADGLELQPQAAFELMAAKLVGRWRDGKSLELERGPDRNQDLTHLADNPIDNDFRYGDDADGHICPMGAHVRRTNPRDLLGRNGDESRRHRIIRRSMPYGPAYRGWGELHSDSGAPYDGQDRGIIFICFNADFERQFELVQRQWCGDGNDFGLGDDQDYLLGSGRNGTLTIEGEPPFFVTREIGAPVHSPDPRHHRLVYTRGCEYLFMPGLAALERLSAPPSRAADLERIPPAEPAAMHATVGLVLEEMHRNYAYSRPVRRGQHPKTHALVQAKFIVTDVPDELRVGLFKKDHEYDAWIRFSASHSKVQSDAKPDAQGIAIKVLGVEGEKVLPTGRYATTQDFVMVNHRIFFLRNARDLAEFARAITATASVRDAKLRAIGFFLRHRDLRGARILETTIGKRPPNPLDLTYWSQTPYALHDIAVKYSVKPVTGTEAVADDPSGWDALGHAIEAVLAPEDAVYEFKFRIQPQVDPTRMPIEDPTHRWNERDSAPRPVAIIRIGHQDASPQERLNFAENLRFTPWHTLWEHRPLGGINRVRRAVYEASSEMRHRLNGVSEWEPETISLNRPPEPAGSDAEAPG